MCNLWLSLKRNLFGDIVFFDEAYHLPTLSAGRVCCVGTKKTPLEINNSQGSR